MKTESHQKGKTNTTLKRILSPLRPAANWLKRVTRPIRMMSVRHYRLIKESGLFEKDWYLKNNKGFFERMNPILHYLLWGAAKGLDPSPLFSSSHYLINNPDVNKAKMNPLVHYLLCGKNEGRAPYPVYVTTLADLLDLLDHSPAPPSPLPQSVDIIIPVYNGMAHLPALFDSIFKNTSHPHRFIIVDDFSPDPAVRPYLEARTAGRDDCMLILNPQNMGFIATVNRAARECKGHFVILNTDTIVPPGWLERLILPIFNDAGIASTTPFSNAATIFSFPAPHLDNPLPDELYVQRLDRAFKRLRPDLTPLNDAPTGVGFCMGINGTAWRSIGEFDREAFGCGYGEENDWCRRAMANGYRNILVHNLFVAHYHAGSFHKETKQYLGQRNLEVIRKRWPDYLSAVERHVKSDPWMAFRKAAFLALCLSPESKPLVFLDHMIGGGANYYRDKSLAKAHAEGRSTILLTYNREERRIMVSAEYKGFKTKFIIQDAEDIARLLLLGNPETVVVNELVTWSDPMLVLKTLLRARANSRFQLEMAVHDFYPLCPGYNLINNEGRYCGVPSELEVCAGCNSENEFSIDNSVIVEQWREKWREFVKNTDRVLFFSRSTLEIFCRAYPEVRNKGEVQPHEPLVVFSPIEREHPQLISEPFTIGVVGRIDTIKGALMVRDLAQLLHARKPGWRVVVIGLLSPPCAMDNVITLGPYQREDLPAIIDKHNVNIAFFPSICPETFSYVTQELVMLGLPIVCFGVGAQAEQVRKYSKGQLASQITAESALDAIEILMARANSSKTDRNPLLMEGRKTGLAAK